MNEETTCPKCGSPRFQRQPTGSACLDCNYRELDDQTSSGWTRVAIGKCPCGYEYGTRACAIGVDTPLDGPPCPNCQTRRSSMVRWALGRADPIVISEDRPHRVPTA